MLEIPNNRRKSNIVPPNLPTVPSGVEMGSDAFELSEESNDLKESGEQQEVKYYPQFITQYEHLLMLIELIELIIRL
jgi:hypothetical protein